MPATLDEVLREVIVIRSVVEKLQATIAKLGTASSSQAGGGGGSGASDMLPEEKLRESWADKEVKRLPKNWEGRNVVGQRYSDLSGDEATTLASFFQWKADNPQIDPATGAPKLQTSGKNAGKPWADADAFEAKILRTWAKVASQRPKPKANGKAAEEPADPFDAGPGTDFANDDEIPF